jgi:hypothetical protein
MQSEHAKAVAFAHNRIGINGKVITADHVLNESSSLTHIVHRHETAVTAVPPKVPPPQ